MSEKIYLRRQDKLKSLLANEGLDGMVITNLTNIRYLCGFTGSAATCLILPDRQYFISDGRYTTQSRAQVKGFERIIQAGPHIKIMSSNGNNLIPKGLKLGYEGEYLPVNKFNELLDKISSVKWENTFRILENLQAVKDSGELDAIRTAVEITDKVYDDILPMLKIGVTEKEIALEFITQFRKLADGEAYAPIVAGGPNSALPHAVPTDRPFENGDFIVIDAAALYGGYHADMTRTPVIGEATDKHKEIYEIVKGSQQAGLDRVCAGKSCKEIDSVTRDYIAERGYGEFFSHGTGHGLGLEIHTQPMLNQLSNQVLEENNVVTIEPGIYLEGWGGVRIEDDIIVTKDGCEVLNQTSKELMVL